MNLSIPRNWKSWTASETSIKRGNIGKHIRQAVELAILEKLAASKTPFSGHVVSVKISVGQSLAHLGNEETVCVCGITPRHPEVSQQGEQPAEGKQP